MTCTTRWCMPVLYGEVANTIYVHVEHNKTTYQQLILSLQSHVYYVYILTGTYTFLNISTPRLASNRAMSCGVVTITAPSRDENRNQTNIPFTHTHNSAICQCTDDNSKPHTVT